ncbi:MAG: peptide deformylase [Succinivibrionaceae bacterium]
MSLLDLLYFPDEKLRKPCASVEIFDEQLDNTIFNMFETMYHNEGIGLAAPQVGIYKKLVVIDVVGDKKEENQIVLINPIIIEKSGTTGIEEGCLSVPGLKGFVERAEQITVSALNKKGEEFHIKADGLLAICIQHELDHLNGKLFIDYLSPMKKNLYRVKAAKLAKERKKNKDSK